jgi:hypothetical protein
MNDDSINDFVQRMQDEMKADARKMYGESIFNQFDSLPEEQRHCAYHAAATLYKAADKFVAEREAGKTKSKG